MDFKLSELVSDVLGGRMHLCPRCRRDLTESVRAHLYEPRAPKGTPAIQRASGELGRSMSEAQKERFRSLHRGSTMGTGTLRDRSLFGR